MTETEGKVEIVSFATFGSIMTALMIASVVGNIVCFRLTNRLVRNKPSLALVLNLCVSDVLVTLFTWTAFMTQHISRHTGTDIDVIVHKVFWSAIIALGCATILTLSGLAADCFVALRWPLHHQELSTPKAVRVYVVVTWSLSVASGIGDFILAAARSNAATSYRDAIRNTMVFSASVHATLSAKIAASPTLLLSNSLSVLCLGALVLIYTYILAKIKRIKLNKALSKQGGLRSELHAVRTTLMIFTSFLLLFAPTLAVNVVTVIEPNFLSKLSLLEASFIGYLADCLLLVHSLVNAIIYGVRVSKTINRQKRSRLTLQDYFRRARRDSCFSSSFSSYSHSPSRQESLATLARISIENATPAIAVGGSVGSREQYSKLHTICELTETQPTDVSISEYDVSIEDSPELYRQLADTTNAESNDSSDEGIGMTSDTGSQSRETELAITPRLSAARWAETAARWAGTSTNNPPGPNRPSHRKHRRAKSLDYSHTSRPDNGSVKRSSSTVSALGVANAAFLWDGDSADTGDTDNPDSPQHSGAPRGRNRASDLVRCKCSTNQSSTTSIISCTKL